MVQAWAQYRLHRCIVTVVVGAQSVLNIRHHRRLRPELKAHLPFPIKVRLPTSYVEFLAASEKRAVRRHVRVPEHVTAERIERALNRVAEIIVARGDQGEAWLPLYDHLERALHDHHAKEERLAAVRQRVIRSRDRTAARSS
ncbi:hypothetical protein MesoLj131a_58440 [Mesorhizobium sp. 131-2-1]|nr:hypothetical protein MesoLj131a_58440 [Mesorhizobium sp. 131-2-1]